MKKVLVFCLLTVIAIILAGIYGMVHDQISYTISPEYYTKFKFHQFGLDGMAVPDRARVSIVGLLASWWMGIPIGLLVGGFGFIQPGHWRMLKVTLCSFLVVIIFTAMFGLFGLLYGWFRTRDINLSDYQEWFIPNDVVDLRRFLCVGYMHNSSYLGGTLGVFIGCAFHVIVRIKMRSQFL
jgi:hypothetical protein